MGSKINPKLVFDNPDQYLDFITQPNDRDFEGQHFDRKEVPRAQPDGAVRDLDLSNFRNERIIPALSGFANQNHQGGLLVLGISSAGQFKGLNHLSENQINSIAQVSYVINHKVEFKIHEFVANGSTYQIGLFYSAYVSNAICETASRPRRAWKRSGLQNLELSDIEVDSMKRNKGVVSYERTQCVRFDENDIDPDVYKEFSSNYLDSATYNWTYQELLRRIGATSKVNDTDFWLTNAGALFFSVNPEKDIPQAYIRLVRFDVSYSDHKNRPAPTYDKKFSGSITKQIRDFRTFIQDSAFFEVYQRRNPTGGFIEEPEYP